MFVVFRPLLFLTKMILHYQIKMLVCRPFDHDVSTCVYIHIYHHFAYIYIHIIYPFKYLYLPSYHRESNINGMHTSRHPSSPVFGRLVYRCVQGAMRILFWANYNDLFRRLVTPNGGLVREVSPQNGLKLG